METSEQVCGDAAVGDSPAYGCDAAEVPFAGVFAVHGFEYLVAAALYR